MQNHNWQSYNPEQGWHADPAALVWTWHRRDVSALVRSRASASSAVSDVCATDDANKVEVGDEVYIPKYKHNNPWIVTRKSQDTITLKSSPHSIDPEHPRDDESRMRMFNVSARDIDHDRTVRAADLRHHLRELNPRNFFDMYSPAE